MDFHRPRRVLAATGHGWRRCCNRSTAWNVTALAFTASGELAAGGSFNFTDGKPMVSFARMASTCSAAAVPYGAGCAGSNGLLALVPRQLPWIGSAYRAEVAGVAGGAVLFEMFGWAAQGIPLVTLHPAGGVGCQLLTTPDATSVVLPVAGVATTQMVIPNALALVGVLLRNQVLQAELDSGANLVGLQATNAVALTIGAF